MPRDGRLARARLRDAALDLYETRGYGATTTAQIAERAGVTERTYFRHFADKREVLFDGEEELSAQLADAIAAAPADREPMAVLVGAFIASVPLFVANRELAARRAQIIASTPALQERALAKTAGLVDALAAALAARGVPDSKARLAAQAGMATFEHAHRAWVADPSAALEGLVEQASEDLFALTHRR